MFSWDAIISLCLLCPNPSSEPFVPNAAQILQPSTGLPAARRSNLAALREQWHARLVRTLLLGEPPRRLRYPVRRTTLLLGCIDHHLCHSSQSKEAGTRPVSVSSQTFNRLTSLLLHPRKLSLLLGTCPISLFSSQDHFFPFTVPRHRSFLTVLSNVFLLPL